MSASVSDLDILLGDLERTCLAQKSGVEPVQPANGSPGETGTQVIKTRSDSEMAKPTDKNLNELDSLLEDLSKAR